MDELMALIVLWLSTTFGFSQPDALPAVRTVSSGELVLVRSAGQVGGFEDDLLAIYDDRTETILLRDGWDIGSVTDVSILVHELVHHLQNGAGLTFDCPEAREQLAFEAQEQWLRMFGTDLEAAFGLDSLSVKVKTHCWLP